MGETSVIVVSPHSSRNETSTDEIAIASGTSASHEPNTNTSTTSAPTPPRTASSRTPVPWSASPVESIRAS